MKTKKTTTKILSISFFALVFSFLGALFIQTAKAQWVGPPNTPPDYGTIIGERNVDFKPIVIGDAVQSKSGRLGVNTSGSAPDYGTDPNFGLTVGANGIKTTGESFFEQGDVLFDQTPSASIKSNICFVDNDANTRDCIASWADVGNSIGPDADWNVVGNNLESAVTGNVGIGVSPAATDKLSISGGNFNLNGEKIINSGEIALALGENNGLNFANKIRIDADDGVISGTKYFRFATNDATYPFGFIGANVGIGTASPSEALDVFGNINVSGTVDGYDLDIYGPLFIDTAGSAGQIWKSDGVGRGYWDQETDPNVNTLGLTQSLNSCPDGYVAKKSGSSWVCAPDDSGITAEVDPQVNTLNANRWCVSDGTQINCTANPPVLTESDPTVVANVKDGVTWNELLGLSCASGEIVKYNGSAWACSADQGLGSESDPQVGNIANNYVPKWNGSALITGTIFDNGNVGIGTTSFSSGDKVAIAGGNLNLNNNKIRNSGEITFPLTGLGNALNFSNLARVNIDTSDNTFKFATNSSYPFNFVGNVGINRVPRTGIELDVFGDVRASGTICDSNGCIGTSGAGSVGSAQIIDNSITSIDIQDGTITSADIQNNTITSIDIQDNSITGADIQDGTLTYVDTNVNSIQRRVTGFCAAGSSIRVINSNGTVTCEIDDQGTGGITSESDTLQSVTNRGNSTIQSISVGGLSTGGTVIATGEVRGSLFRDSNTGSGSYYVDPGAAGRSAYFAGRVEATYFRDRNNGYNVDPSGGTTLNNLTITGSLGVSSSAPATGIHQRFVNPTQGGRVILGTSGNSSRLNYTSADRYCVERGYKYGFIRDTNGWSGTQYAIWNGSSWVYSSLNGESSIVDLICEK